MYIIYIIYIMWYAAYNIIMYYILYSVYMCNANCDEHISNTMLIVSAPSHTVQ